jgi:hypothetical protein
MTETGVRNGDERHPLTIKSQNRLHLALSLPGLVHENFLQVALAEIYPVHKPRDLSSLLMMWSCFPTDGLKRQVLLS